MSRQLEGFFSASELKRRGWKKSEITALEVDRFVTNPYFPNKSKMKLFDEQKIINLEKNMGIVPPESSKIKDRTEEAINYLSSVKIKVKGVPLTILSENVKAYSKSRTSTLGSGVILPDNEEVNVPFDLNLCTLEYFIHEHRILHAIVREKFHGNYKGHVDDLIDEMIIRAVCVVYPFLKKHATLRKRWKTSLMRD